MPTACVILAEDDRSFVEERVLPVLPSQGYEWWVPGRVSALERCEVVLIVCSPALLAPAAAAAELEAALEVARTAGRTLIVVQIAKVAAPLPDALSAASRVDFTDGNDEEARRLLAVLLPPVERPEGMPPEHAERIAWNAPTFSAALSDATKRHDHVRAASLVEVLARHLASGSEPYPDKAASADLYELRREREFVLMRRYGDAVLASGTRKDEVLRQYAQALIETKDYGRAIEVLQSILNDQRTSAREVREAYGLMGRTFKQQYVEAPDPGEAADLIRQAIAAYLAVFDRDGTQAWHGVNAASCILRARRDGVAAEPPARAKTIAQRVLENLEKAEKKSGSLAVWDCASRVEALLALARYKQAAAALDAYLHHPGLRAFEVSSTFRQFDEVLELGRNPRGAPLLARLRATVERYRADTLPGNDTAMALVLRVSDPSWEPGAVTGLAIQTRLGTIITARGSEATVRELITDPMVISVEESRPGGTMECARSLPFLKIAAKYSGAAGPYEETGARALIAVIDNGIDVLHEAFLDKNGNSRILGIWDQRDLSGTPPQGFTYGMFHDEAAIAGYVKARKVPFKLGRNINGHGTHVASIAAGRKAGAFAGGVAPDAKLLIVISASRESIGYSASHIEALSFISGFASARKLPVVVNLSQGTNAGAHDGMSPLEIAFDTFAGMDTSAGRVVVKSAGNERGKKGHAFVALPPGSADELRWKRVTGADPTERIELWWDNADEIQFRLRDPFGERTKWVGLAAPETEDKFTQGGPYRLVFTNGHRDNGDNLLRIDLGGELAYAALGEWLLEIKSAAAPKGGEIHAWIERRKGKPTRFLDHVSEDMTLSIPATARSVISVGAIDASNPFRVAAFSSYGPTRKERPNQQPFVCAPGVKVLAARGGTTGGVKEDSGTSMAAAHMTGAIALLLSHTAESGRVPNANQIIAKLQHKTQNCNWRWNRGQGYGVLDVCALLNAF